MGSTTTKARFFRRINDEWRFVAAGEAPTTVEAPYEDVTMGARNAIREVEELTGQLILAQDGTGVIIGCQGNRGIDIYCTTSSAGGGLQMTVAGAILSMTAESANRAALGAGAVVMDIMAVNDGRAEYQKIEDIRTLRPDMILLAGGTDGGSVRHVVEIAELIEASRPMPRLGMGYTLPIVYSGNKDAVKSVEELLGKKYALKVVDNLRPTLEVENTEPARNAIHELFMEHVMSHAPGYDRLMKWTSIPIMPTPAGEGIAIQLIGKLYKKNVIGVGLGGATTNIYSVFDGKFVRSVSANLGMSYSICNVLKEAGIKNITRWLPFDIDEGDVRNRLRNKMIRPTTIPQTLEDLVIEQAVARESLRLGLKHHKTIATRLKGTSIDMEMALDQFTKGVQDSYIDMMQIGILAGTGGLLSHAPRRIQSFMALTDAWQPEGVTRIMQDSVFMMPHLGVLSTVHEEAAMHVFDMDCLVRVGTVVAVKGVKKPGEEALEVDLKTDEGQEIKEKLSFGEIKLIPLAERHIAEGVLRPAKGLDLGKGDGHELQATVHGGTVGLVLDARGRPLEFPEDESQRKSMIKGWIKSLNMYSLETLKV